MIILLAIGVFSSFITQITSTMSSLRSARTEQPRGSRQSDSGNRVELATLAFLSKAVGLPFLGVC